MPVKDARELYGVPLDEFVAERAALAKALRSSGEGDEAARVAKLGKPSVAAWTVNQLTRSQGRAIDALFAAGDAVVAAQSELLAGRGDAAVLRDTGRRERDARDRLTEIARGLLNSKGHEPTSVTLERVSETLHAAALDPAARSLLRDGCLVKELRHVGLGGDAPSVAPERQARSASHPRASSPRGRGTGSAQSTARTADDRPVADHRARERELAQRAAAEAERLDHRAARELDAARECLDGAQESLRDAERNLTVAKARADEAALAHRRAKAALDRI